MQQDINLKADQSSLDRTNDDLTKKNERKEMTKEIDRLDALIEEMRQSISGFLDKQTGLSKEVDRLSQFIDMLSKTINQLRVS